MNQSGSEGESESKVLFRNGERPRTIRGVIVSEDGEFIMLKRRDGTIRLSKRYIIKIETRGV